MTVALDEKSDETDKTEDPAKDNKHKDRGSQYRATTPVNPQYEGRCPTCRRYHEAVKQSDSSVTVSTHKSRKGDPCPGTGQTAMSSRFKRAKQSNKANVPTS